MDALYHLGKILGKASGHQIRDLEESSEWWSLEADVCPPEDRTPKERPQHPLSVEGGTSCIAGGRPTEG